LLEFGLGISFIFSVHNWCLQPPHGASLQARTNHAIMTGQVHSSCDANLGTSMIDLGLPRSKKQKSVGNTAFHRTSTNCHPPRLPPGPFERPRQDAIFVAATFLSGGLGRAAKKENHFSPILACTHAFHCFSPTVDIQPSEPQQKLILGLFRNLCSCHIFGEGALPGKLPKRLISVMEICARCWYLELHAPHFGYLVMLGTSFPHQTWAVPGVCICQDDPWVMAWTTLLIRGYSGVSCVWELPRQTAPYWSTPSQPWHVWKRGWRPRKRYSSASQHPHARAVSRPRRPYFALIHRHGKDTKTPAGWCKQRPELDA